MRLRRLLITTLVGVILLTAAASYWPLGGTAERSRQSRMLELRFLGYTNGNAIVQIKNRASQGVWLHPHVYIYSRDPFRIVYNYEITNAQPLAGRATQIAAFPAPTDLPHWRAEVGGVGMHEVKINNALSRTWPFKLHPWANYVRYAQTDWMTP